MIRTNPLAVLGTLCAAIAILVTAPPASAVITDLKDSADFTYQYNGDTTPTDPTADDQFGNTGYKAEGGASFQNVSMTSDGDILSVFPTVPNDPPVAPPATDTRLNMQSSLWNDAITDATGFTWEISLKLNPTPGTTFEGGTLSRNRLLFRVGDVDNNPDEVQPFSSAQLQIDFDGDLNNSGLRLPSVSDDFHVYRMAQAPNSDATHLWVDGELLSSELARTKPQPGHWWGDFWGETASFDIDYVRFEAGAYAPVPEPATASLLLFGSLMLWGLRRQR